MFTPTISPGFNLSGSTSPTTGRNIVCDQEGDTEISTVRRLLRLFHLKDKHYECISRFSHWYPQLVIVFKIQDFNGWEKGSHNTTTIQKMTIAISIKRTGKKIRKVKIQMSITLEDWFTWRVDVFKTTHFPFLWESRSMLAPSSSASSSGFISKICKQREIVDWVHILFKTENRQFVLNIHWSYMYLAPASLYPSDVPLMIPWYVN